MRLADEKHISSIRKAHGTNGTGKSQNRFKTFQPTKVERLAIREDERELSEVIKSLAGHMDDGELKLSLGKHEAHGSFFVIARESGTDWQKAAALSVWHNELELCFRILDYALNGPYAGFPQATEIINMDDLSW